MTDKMITRIDVVVCSRPGILTKQNEYKVEQLPILAENEEFYCVNDYFFNTVSKNNTYSSTRGKIDKPSISCSVGDSCWGTSVRYNLWTFKKKRPETIKKEIREFLDNKYGGLMNMSLDFIGGEA